jgi:NADH:ubiquinone oxidoreductase subunit 4 (subunit M)
MIKTPFQTKWDAIKVAHGVLSGLGVLFILLGAILIRLISASYSVRIHYGTQVFALILLLAGFGSGVWLALQNNSVSYRAGFYSHDVTE